MRRLRADVGDTTDGVVRDLTAAWVDAWDRLEASWQYAIVEVLELIARHQGPPPAYLFARLERLTAALQETRVALGALAGTSAAAAGAGAGTVIAATAAAEPYLIASQLPAGMAAAAAATYAARIAPSALEVIAQRCRERIHAKHWHLEADAVEAMRRALVTGVAAGDNPRTAARHMLRLTETHFNGGLARATVIARTELLDAYRETSQHVHDENADVLAGWVWIASLGERTCPSCWGMHGTRHPLSEPGPLDHQAGRCARMPKVKTWAELGIAGVEDADDQVPDAGAAFADLPPATQAAIMGPRRLQLLQSGRITMADLPRRRESAEWRRSYVPTSVRDLEQLAGRRP